MQIYTPILATLLSIISLSAAGINPEQDHTKLPSNASPNKTFLSLVSLPSFDYTAAPLTRSATLPLPEELKPFAEPTITGGFLLTFNSLEEFDSYFPLFGKRSDISFEILSTRTQKSNS